MLSVTGECNLPATYRTVLEVHEPQGDDPTQLILDLVVTLPSGLESTDNEARCTLNVAFKMNTEQDYETVLIVDKLSDEDESWEIPVRVLKQAVAEAPMQGSKWSSLPRDYTH